MSGFNHQGLLQLSTPVFLHAIADPGFMLWMIIAQGVARYMLFRFSGNIHLKETIMKTIAFTRFENFMAAVTFAEKGDHEYAIHLVNSVTKKKNQNPSKRIQGDHPESRRQM